MRENRLPLVHQTIAISRMVDAPTDAVFAAWEDPQARSQWGPPSDDEALAFVETDFRVGGTDVHLCGPKGDLRFRVETRYYDIERPARLVFTERLSTGDALLSASLVSVAIGGNGRSTKLDLTVQIASAVGRDMIVGTRTGWEAALSNLAKSLV